MSLTTSPVFTKIPPGATEDEIDALRFPAVAERRSETRHSDDEREVGFAPIRLRRAGSRLETPIGREWDLPIALKRVGDRLQVRYSDDQPRDDHGRFAGGGGSAPASTGGGGSASSGGSVAAQAMTELDSKGLSGPAAFNAVTSGEVPDTLARYTTPQGELDADRADLHTQIIENAVGDRPSQASPVALFTAGGPASGKSSLYSGGMGGIAPPPDAVVIDPDAIKTAIPEYQEMIDGGHADAASAFTHEEASQVSGAVRQTAMANQQNMVVDTLGDTGTRFADKIDQAQAAGYAVTVRYATVDPAVAADRADGRAIATGRALETNMVLNAHASVANTFNNVVSGKSGIAIEMYDTSGSRPQLYASRDTAGNWNVANQAVYDRFVAQGQNA